MTPCWRVLCSAGCCGRGLWSDRQPQTTWAEHIWTWHWGPALCPAVDHMTYRQHAVLEESGFLFCPELLPKNKVVNVILQRVLYTKVCVCTHQPFKWLSRSPISWRFRTASFTASCSGLSKTWDRKSAASIHKNQHSYERTETAISWNAKTKTLLLILQSTVT